LFSYLFLFFDGSIVGHYEIFPFQLLSQFNTLISNYEEPAPYPIDHIYQNDIESLIHISSSNDIDEKRNSLINFIWKENGFPISLPTIEHDLTDPDFYDMVNLKQIDSLTIEMKHGINSIGYLFLAENSNNDLIVFHQGHAKQNFSDDKELIQYFLDKGYSVLILVMVTHGMNNEPIVEFPEFGKIKLESHKYFKFLDDDSFSSISYFVEPPAVFLNYIDENFSFNSYHMIGLSGGGWVTTLYSAIDPRIEKSFSVAGSVPIFLRHTPPSNFGDHEQTLPELYRIANYLDLYVMASFGENRNFIQIFNKYDPCCFSGDYYTTYEKFIQSRVSELNSGQFEIFLDDSHENHIISDKSIEFIINKIENEP